LAPAADYRCFVQAIVGALETPVFLVALNPNANYGLEITHLNFSTRAI